MTARFVLEPLTVAHSNEMVDVLAPTDLYAFTGGEAPSLEDLRALYGRQSIGHSAANDAGWLNWIIRSKDTRGAIGYMQATVTREAGGLSADLAWLITPAAQGTGAATEASRAVCDWLRSWNVNRIRALVHPDHEASARVAQRIGLKWTSELVDGEVVWQAIHTAPPPPVSGPTP
jgi:RimJ/RimL family protein N-acetyltransferase